MTTTERPLICARCASEAVGIYREQLLCHAHVIDEVEGPSGPARPWLAAGVTPVDPRKNAREKSNTQT